MTERKTAAAGLSPVPGNLQQILCFTDAHTHGQSLIRAFARAESDHERDAALDALGEYSWTLTWLVAPLAERAHGNEAKSLIHHWAEQLKDFRRPWVQFHPSDFPKDPDKSQQILDAVEGVGLLLKKRKARNERRAA